MGVPAGHVIALKAQRQRAGVQGSWKPTRRAGVWRCWSQEGRRGRLSLEGLDPQRGTSRTLLSAVSLTTCSASTKSLPGL